MRAIGFFLNKPGFLSGRGFLFQKKSVLIFLLFFYAFPSGAVKIRFPDEELSAESVLPLVEPPQMVLNRNIPLKFKTELGLGSGFGLDEPFYFAYYPTGVVVFHLNSFHAISLTGVYFFPWLSGSGKALAEGIRGNEGLLKLDAHKAPYPQISLFLNYQYSPYYGKISLSKSWVMNLSIYGFIGPGLVVSDQNDYWPAGNFGLGQKLYLNKWLGVRVDLSFYGYYGPAIARLDLGENKRKVFYKQLSPEQKSLIINFVANVGMIFLI